MVVKELEYNDYETLVDYWKRNRFPVIPKQMLPNNGIGGIKLVDENDIIIAAGFLYETNSKIAWIEWIVLSPDFKGKKEREKVKTELIANLVLEAEEKGFETVFSSVKKESLVKNFVEVGFTASNTTELILKIK